jgi:hypothetical protein
VKIIEIVFSLFRVNLLDMNQFSVSVRRFLHLRYKTNGEVISRKMERINDGIVRITKQCGCVITHPRRHDITTFVCVSQRGMSTGVQLNMSK